MSHCSTCIYLENCSGLMTHWTCFWLKYSDSKFIKSFVLYSQFLIAFVWDSADLLSQRVRSLVILLSLLFQPLPHPFCFLALPFLHHFSSMATFSEQASERSSGHRPAKSTQASGPAWMSPPTRPLVDSRDKISPYFCAPAALSLFLLWHLIFIYLFIHVFT